jgi:hypothetical protein
MNKEERTRLRIVTEFLAAPPPLKLQEDRKGAKGTRLKTEFFYRG